MREEDIDEARAERMKGVPKHLKGLYRKAWDGKSRQCAIRAFCLLECMGGNRAEVARCLAATCPLYEFRGA